MQRRTQRNRELTCTSATVAISLNAELDALKEVDGANAVLE